MVAPDVDLHSGSDWHVGRQEREGNAVLEHRREVAAGDDADWHSIHQHGLISARRPAAFHDEPSESAGHSPLAFGQEWIATSKASLLVQVSTSVPPQEVLIKPIGTFNC